MRVYELKFVQKVPVGISEAWCFFSDPVNLGKITPDTLDFKIQLGAGVSMYAGQIIHYKLKPLWGIPARWTTEITQVRENEMFVDQQIAGPYRLWHHKHFFREIEGGVEMTDLLHYALPLGILGRWMNRLVVAKKVNEIFHYRKKALEEHFGIMK